MIREFIGGCYAGMRKDDVVVIDTNADPHACPTDDPIARKQCEEEASLEQEVLNILQGYGPIRVSAYIDLRGCGINQDTPTIVRKSNPASHAPGASTGNRTLLGELFEAVTQVRGNRAARIGQVPEKTPAAATVSVQKVDISASTLTSARLSIGIPESYYQRVWRQSYLRNHPESRELDVPAMDVDQLSTLRQHTKTNIATAVTPALMSRIQAAGGPPPLDPSRIAVDVWSYPDFSSETPSNPTLAPTLNLQSAYQYWPQISIGMLALAIALIGLGLFRSDRADQLRSSNKHPSPSDVAISPELSDLVDENPELAIDALRAWLAEAA